MTPAEFIVWRQRMGLNRTQAAEALGVSKNMPKKFEDGTAPISRLVALGCAALIRGMPPWPG